ncbi:uncharacterized protein LTR77_008065 [Saxophila tyrrhenica]|uniref:GH64 domain-containing protein n=1 Tax=Saxophila tyrrhenica TaxID=1690608 RepID=A0AAV9P2I9_9PEZI|nr:hypothetical protein LTR77_008065 [Saxophila tyrrhenica]
MLAHVGGDTILLDRAAWDYASRGEDTTHYHPPRPYQDQSNLIMKTFFGLVVALVALFQLALAAPVVIVDPGNAGDIIITKENTINATNPAPPSSNSSTLAAQKWTKSGKLPLALRNNFPGGAINAYVTGLDRNNRLVMLKPDGTFFYPSANRNIAAPQLVTANVAIPLGARGSTKHITIPDYISSARVWFAEGKLKFFTIYSDASGGPSLVEPSAVNPSDPSSAINWGFVELTNTANGGLYANISYVDFVGLVLGMKLDSADGTQIAKGLRADAVSSICKELKAQGARDGNPWGDLCMVGPGGKPLRVLAPSDYVASNPRAFGNYWNDYNNKVWSHYTSNHLTINTQTARGHVNCKVSGNQIKCDGDNRGYAKPTAGDIFGCNSGPFGILGSDNDVHRAVVPRLCAAFNRGTLLKTGGNIQPGLAADHYYSTTPSNWYSKFVHQYEVDGKGYAFPYDDVNPAIGVDQAGVVADAQPELLTVIVGGPL